MNMQDEPERDPMRFLHLHGPSVYNGQLGKHNLSQQANCASVFIVNGSVDKCDSNFIGDFFFEKLPDHDIFQGSYPSSIDDIIKLSEAGVNAVLNLQTPDNMAARSVDTDQMKFNYD